MPLVLMRSIPEFPEPVEEHGPCQGIFRLAFVEPDMNAPPQCGAADVLKQEQRPFRLCEFSQRHGQPILTRIGAELAEHQRPLTGHPFGLYLPGEEKAALIAFLKTR